MSEHARQSWLPLGVAATILAATLGAIVLAGGEDPPVCAREVEASSPLLPPDRFDEDPRLARLAGAVDAMGGPFGEVSRGVGYDFDQFLRLYGLGDGLLAFTKDNAPMTLLDAKTLQPRWSVEAETKRTAWDASGDRFVLLNLSATEPVRVGSFDLATGEPDWCVVLTAKHRDGQPVSTALLDDGDVLVALPTASGLNLARLSGEDGHARWSTPLEDVGRADYLAQVSEDSFLVGGVESFRLDGEGAAGLVLGSLEDGELQDEGDTSARNHVVGVSGSTVVLLSRDQRGTRLHATNLDGGSTWDSGYSLTPPDVTLRGDVVIVRDRATLAGYSATTGEGLWRRLVPTDRTYFPYGFTLSQMPSLDALHLLMPTTESLEVLDVRTGKSASYPLPTDGVSTTYWPYQLAVTDDAIAVITNTGAVVTRR